MTGPGRAILEIVSVPAGHPYVRRVLGGRPADLVVRPDPDPDHPERVATGRWWPPVALRADWVAQQSFDVLHLHFGFDAATPAELAGLLQVLERTGRPLVLTVHDLRSPHQQDSTVLDAQLDVLVPRAAAVLTLTRQAAGRILARWGREATVVAHPHLVPLAAMTRLRTARTAPASRGPGHDDVVVGLSAKSLRPNTDPARLLPVLERTVAALGSTRLRVDLHRDVSTHPGARQRALVAQLEAARARGVEVVVHDPFADDDLWDHLAGLDVAVLPYCFGTHSGWLEACHDVGTRVLAPSTGCYADQGADAVYAADEHGVDESSLADALTHLVRLARTAGPAGADAAARAAQLEQVRDAHLEVYRRVLDPHRRAAPVFTGPAGPSLAGVAS